MPATRPTDADLNLNVALIAALGDSLIADTLQALLDRIEELQRRVRELEEAAS